MTTPRHLPLLSLGLAVLVVALAAPAYSLPPNCQTYCNCGVSCAESCSWDGPLFSSEITTCGEAGEDCATSPSCAPPPPPPCGNLSCTTYVYLTGGNDTYTGSASRECIFGYGGADTLDGEAGDDRIYAGSGNDTVYGGSGNDCLWGEGNDDHLDGESGNDWADGGSGYDVCTAETRVSCP